MPIDELKWIVNMICPRKFNELMPGPHVKRSCHALSIDDERRTFHPELWNETGVAAERVEQVWFAGVHSNVGGGYPKQGMSLVALTVPGSIAVCLRESQIPLTDMLPAIFLRI